jgi:hypothetical protein
MARKSKIPNKPSIHGADGRHYINPAYYGFPDPQGNAARILAQMISVKVRADMFQKEIGAKQAKIEQLQRDGHKARIDAYVHDAEFPDISEVDALKSDIEELQERVTAARYATEILAGELSRERSENYDAYMDVLRDLEQELQDRWMEIQRQAQEVLEDWRAHARLVDGMTDLRPSLDSAHPSRPIMLRDPDDIVMDSMKAGAIL